MLTKHISIPRQIKDTILCFPAVVWARNMGGAEACHLQTCSLNLCLCVENSEDPGNDSMSQRLPGPANSGTTKQRDQACSRPCQSTL